MSYAVYVGNTKRAETKSLVAANELAKQVNGIVVAVWPSSVRA